MNKAPKSYSDDARKQKGAFLMLHNNASGPEIAFPGRILVGTASKSALRMAEVIYEQGDVRH